MMGKQRRQVSFKDIQVWADQPVVPPDSFYGRMAVYGDQLVQADWFAKLYSHRGRPSIPPTLLSKVLLLMFHENKSDREAEQSARYDLRWKVALNLGIDEVGFDATSLCRFRSRLLLHDKERLFFERTVKAAKEVGLIHAEVAAVVDSTPVLGAGAVQDTYNLLRSAVRKVLQAVERRPEMHQRLRALLERSDYDEKGKPEIHWEDPQERQKLLNEFVRDARTLLKETENLDLDAAGTSARELLAAVTEQDIAAAPDGTVRIRQGVAEDRVISTSDPEMRHGHKTSKGRFDGYKAHVMEDPQAEIVTAIAVTAANLPDAEALPAMLEQQQAAGLRVTQVTGDTAYGSGDTRAAMVGREIELTAPVPPERKGEFFAKSAFVMDLQARTCRCPAGQVVKMTGRHKPGQEGNFQFGAFCGDCPLRALCTNSKNGRSVKVHRHEELLREGRAKQQSEAFQAAYRKRPIIERKFAEMVRHGLRQARYIGKAKVLLQVAWTAAVVNLKKLWKELSGVTAPPKRTRAALSC